VVAQQSGWSAASFLWKNFGFDPVTDEFHVKIDFLIAIQYKIWKITLRSGGMRSGRSAGNQEL